MSQFSRVRFSDEALTQNLTRNTATSNWATAHQVADIAEFDRRKLFRPAGYPCMRVYCVEKLGISEDAASRRIQAARAALRYPELFEALADGRLHLTAINLLAAHLTHENVGALIEAAARKSKAAIERFLAERFPKSEMLALVDVLPSSGGEQSHALAHVDVHVPVDSHALAHVNAHVSRVHPRWHARVEHIARHRFGWHVPVGQEAQDLLRAAQELLSNEIPDGDMAEILRRALKTFVAVEMKKRFGSASRPRKNPRYSTDGRYIPKHVRRAVWERDGGQCTFVGESGCRCPARRGLQFDHIIERARGGKSTVENLRLRCHAHNQYSAEQTFGEGFMHEKREAARQARADRRTPADAAKTAAESDGAPNRTQKSESVAEAMARAKATAAAEALRDREVGPWLRALGFKADEARRAEAFCETVDLPLEDRVRVAISYLRPGAYQGASPAP